MSCMHVHRSEWNVAGMNAMHAGSIGKPLDCRGCFPLQIATLSMTLVNEQLNAVQSCKWPGLWCASPQTFSLTANVIGQGFCAQQGNTLLLGDMQTQQLQ